MPRTTLEVMQDHLARADRGDIEGDISTNFAEDCVLLTTYGRFEGHAGVREAAALLGEQVKDGTWRYLRLDVHDEIAFLEWTGEGSNASVHDGADSFLIRDGTVRVMTIHYTVVEK
jgi:hypothetical protein